MHIFCDGHVRVIAIAGRRVYGLDTAPAALDANALDEVGEVGIPRLQEELPVPRIAGKAHLIEAIERGEIAGKRRTDTFDKARDPRIVGQCEDMRLLAGNARYRHPIVVEEKALAHGGKRDLLHVVGRDIGQRATGHERRVEH